MTIEQARNLTPELLDLMEHEKVIEQGLATFVDVGHALIAIKNGKKYRTAGYATFEDYCQQRWSIGAGRARQLIGAAEAVGSIDSATSVALSPKTEAQVRPLVPLPPERRAEVWAAAVEDAGGGQPTAAVVKAAVDRTAPPEVRLTPIGSDGKEITYGRARPITKPEHPAQFSDDILDVIAGYVTGLDRVLDPFAGVGGVHKLRGKAGVRETIGIELEPEWAGKHPDTITGDALNMVELVGQHTIDAIVTSPAYGNRMADHHDARDDSVRLTYTHTLGRKLTAGNTGAMQWGDEYRDLHRAVWAECVKVLKPGGLLVLNVKDHVRGDRVQSVLTFHVDHICRVLGMESIAEESIVTRGVMAGANADVRVPFERVWIFRRGPA